MEALCKIFAFMIAIASVFSWEYMGGEDRRKKCAVITVLGLVLAFSVLCGKLFISSAWENKVLPEFLWLIMISQSSSEWQPQSYGSLKKSGRRSERLRKKSGVNRESGKKEIGNTLLKDNDAETR